MLSKTSHMVYLGRLENSFVKLWSAGVKSKRSRTQAGPAAIRYREDCPHVFTMYTRMEQNSFCDPPQVMPFDAMWKGMFPRSDGRRCEDATLVVFCFATRISERSTFHLCVNSAESDDKALTPLLQEPGCVLAD
jgi:hypothetical protein